MGTGDSVKGEGICRGLALHLQGLDIVDDFLPLKLGSTDVILVIQWLQTLGTTHTNWKTKVMKFNVGQEAITLRGDPSSGRTLVSLKSMIKTICREGAGLLVELSHLESDGTEERDEPAYLSKVLKQFEVVFQSPQGLPPERGHEHNIVLQEGCPPISVRPYRYPHIQKDEIERLIAEMLAAGIIRVSKSPYSSPVLLVKKKNG